MDGFAVVVPCKRKRLFAVPDDLIGSCSWFLDWFLVDDLFLMKDVKLKNFGRV